MGSARLLPAGWPKTVSPLSLATTPPPTGPINSWLTCPARVIAQHASRSSTLPHSNEIFATNWRGPFATIRALRPLLNAAENAVVINISSVAGITGEGSNVAYCASKAALDSMTRSLGRALAPFIRVVSVSPGWVLGEYAARMPTEMIDAQRAATPLGRLGTPDDVAAAVSAVVNDLPFTTGSMISVDGGRPLGTS